MQAQSYHQDVVAHLKATEPEVWAWASSLNVLEQHVRDTRSMLLRETYRLTNYGHLKAYATAERVLERLEIDAPIVLYQGGDGTMNASLYFLPGEVHVVLHGPVLEKLSEPELTALLGHEMAHFKLWSDRDGEFHTAERILQHTQADPNAAPSHAETLRLYGLHTELYADRGAAVAAQSALPAISTLVRVHTGLASVDPAAYLQQAEELEAADASISKGVSHPESYLRALAVDKWWRRDPDMSQWLRKRLHGPLNMDRLDLCDQLALTRITRRFIALLLRPDFMQGERILTQARAYFPDWGLSEPCASLDELGPDQIADSVREYLNFVMLDLALADPDVQTQALQEAAKTARELGSLDALLAALKRDVGFGKREVDKIVRSLPRQTNR